MKYFNEFLHYKHMNRLVHTITQGIYDLYNQVKLLLLFHENSVRNNYLPGWVVVEITVVVFFSSLVAAGVVIVRVVLSTTCFVVPRVVTAVVCIVVVSRKIKQMGLLIRY